MKFSTILPFLSLAMGLPVADVLSSTLPPGWTWVDSSEVARSMATAVSSEKNLLQKRQPGHVLLCTQPNFSGQCATVDFTIAYTCQAIPAPFINNLGSIRPDKGALCRLTTVSNTATCDLHGDLFVENPGFPDIFNHDGQDYGHNAHHITCQQCTNCQGDGSK